MSQSPPYRGHSNPYKLYYLDSDTVAQTNQYISAWEGEPTWQIVYISDFDNLVDAFPPIGDGAHMACGCLSGKDNKIWTKPVCMKSGNGCKPCDLHNCTTWEVVKTWFHDHF
jgi:hypothetical protein